MIQQKFRNFPFEELFIILLFPFVLLPLSPLPLFVSVYLKNTLFLSRLSVQIINCFLCQPPDNQEAGYNG